jgi:hypothetical protein
MRERRKKYEERGAIDFLLLRDRLGIGRFRKTRPRTAEKKELLLGLWLKTIEEREKNDYIPLGPRRRRLKIS